MNLQLISHHRCSQDQGEGILLVDIESETQPRTDVKGNRLYYCIIGHHVFSVEGSGNTIQCNNKEGQALRL